MQTYTLTCNTYIHHTNRHHTYMHIIHTWTGWREGGLAPAELRSGDCFGDCCVAVRKRLRHRDKRLIESDGEKRETERDREKRETERETEREREKR